jgi:hypothetical protein
MINALHLFWIVPLSVMFGFFYSSIDGSGEKNNRKEIKYENNESKTTRRNSC